MEIEAERALVDAIEIMQDTLLDFSLVSVSPRQRSMRVQPVMPGFTR